MIAKMIEDALFWAFMNPDTFTALMVTLIYVMIRLENSDSQLAKWRKK
jgi:hypothetical protein